jgi:hypothetical protein
VISSILLIATLALVAAGCSWIGLKGFQVTERLSPQGKVQTIDFIDFYAINWDDFPEEKKLYTRAISKIIEEKITQWLGHRIRIVRFEILPESHTSHSERPLASFHFTPNDTYKAAVSSIITKAMSNKAKYLVAKLRANPIDPVAICKVLDKINKSRNSDYYLYIEDTQGNEALLKEVYKILKTCGR